MMYIYSGYLRKSESYEIILISIICIDINDPDCHRRTRIMDIEIQIDGYLLLSSLIMYMQGVSLEFFFMISSGSRVFIPGKLLRCCQ